MIVDYSFAVDCGSNTSTRGSDNTIYEADPANLGAATYYVTGQTRWGVSSVGHYFRATDAKNIIYSSQNFNNVVDSKLFETGRVSPSSLRYYGLGLENGNYTVLLRFAEIAFPDSQTWLSLGRRVFDIYIQVPIKCILYNVFLLNLIILYLKLLLTTLKDFPPAVFLISKSFSFKAPYVNVNNSFR